MIRKSFGVAGLMAVLAGCGPQYTPPSSERDVAASPVSVSGTAVMGVAGGSGQPTRPVSGFKDLEVSVGTVVNGY
ncbi:hypothetical protein [Tropicimonas aquimaris]|uniref:Argininosuccinate lyase n=1 Tax=Tropicimonas aquimaris TaxID=914152 RepID=A0ABW3IMR9_9RHOB